MNLVTMKQVAGFSEQSLWRDNFKVFPTDWEPHMQ